MAQQIIQNCLLFPLLMDHGSSPSNTKVLSPTSSDGDGGVALFWTNPWVTSHPTLCLKISTSLWALAMKIGFGIMSSECDK